MPKNHTPISFTIAIFSFIFCQALGVIAQDDEFEMPTEARMVRIFGGNDETKPPLILINQDKYSARAAFGESFITIQLDVDSRVPPNIYAKFVHCSIDWEEDDNVFLNDLVHSRTSNIQWEAAPIMSRYFSYRGELKVPDSQIKFKYSGNWKVKFYEYYSDDRPIAEGRFFVAEPKADCRVYVFSDFYNPAFNVTNTSVMVEAVVTTKEQLFENQLNSVVVYNNARWYEPYIISQTSGIETFDYLYRYDYETSAAGFISFEKRFRIDGIPAENGYRILDLTDLATYPRVSYPLQKPFADRRRNGSFRYTDQGGVMLSSFLNPDNDDYVNIEFILDPEDRISEYDVFVSGSFNRWLPGPEWQMYFDEETREYKLSRWIRRGNHNYLYATGSLNIDKNRVEKYSYDEYEGNTSRTGHTYIALVYYKEFELGGYYSIIGVGAGNLFGNIGR